MDKDLNPEVPLETKTETPETTPGEESKGEGESQAPETQTKFEDIDTIDDVDVLRRIAKDQYATRMRLGKKLEKNVPEAKPSDISDPLSKKDFYRINEKEAIEQATTVFESDSEQVKEIKKEVNEHWNDVKKYFPSSTSRNRVKDIVEGIYDAHAAWKRRTSGSKTLDGTKTASELAQHNASPAGSGQRPPSGKADTLPRGGESAEFWYKKKE